MGLYEQWNENLKGSPKAAQAFLDAYYEKEKDAYAAILKSGNPALSGTAADIAARLGLTETEFAGFVDGANTSLETPVDIKEMEADTVLSMTFSWPALYKNMLKAKADWLYELPEWDGIYSEEERVALTKEYKASCQAVSHKVGRNDPCPCGSGLKYKNCCGDI